MLRFDHWVILDNFYCITCPKNVENAEKEWAKRCTSLTTLNSEVSWSEKGSSKNHNQHENHEIYETRALSSHHLVMVGFVVLSN